jgi:hypothetical protein
MAPAVSVDVAFTDAPDELTPRRSGQYSGSGTWNLGVKNDYLHNLAAQHAGKLAVSLANEDFFWLTARLWSSQA